MGEGARSEGRPLFQPTDGRLCRRLRSAHRPAPENDCSVACIRCALNWLGRLHSPVHVLQGRSRGRGPVHVVNASNHMHAPDLVAQWYPWCTVCRSEALCKPATPGPAWRSTTQLGIARRSTAQHSTAQHSTAQRSPAQHTTAHIEDGAEVGQPRRAVLDNDWAVPGSLAHIWLLHRGIPAGERLEAQLECQAGLRAGHTVGRNGQEVCGGKGGKGTSVSRPAKSHMCCPSHALLNSVDALVAYRPACRCHACVATVPAAAMTALPQHECAECSDTQQLRAVHAVPPPASHSMCWAESQNCS